MSHFIGMKPSEKDVDNLRQREVAFPRQILESWSRSAAAGVSRMAMALPEVSQSEKDAVVRYVPTGAHYKRRLLQGYLNSLEDTLVMWGGAIVYLDHSLRVFGRLGSDEFLDELKQKHIETGASLAEDVAGTNAASLTRSLLRACKIDPADNYCKLFSDYVCFTQGPMRIGLDDFIIMLIMFPKELVTPRLSQAVESMLYAEGVISELSKTLDVNASLALFDIMMEGQGFSYLVIDENENVVNISRRLLDMLNLRGGTTIGASARELFPELAPLFDACKRITRKNARTKIDGITLNGAPTWAIASLLPSEEYVMTGIALKTDSLDAAGMARRGVSVDRAFAGRSPAMSRMKDAMRKAAAREKDLLITGECGTGKSTSAKVIHAMSPRRNAPFILCNCSLIPDGEAESFLFGTPENPGIIEQAHNGTLFFDGIEGLSPKAQAVLADLLDARSGGIAPVRGAVATDVRIIFSSRIDALELARAQVLSPSFCYRLPSLVIAMPPLRDCTDDIPLIAQSLLMQRLEDGPFDAKVDLPSLDELGGLCAYPWPNNVLELKSALDWACDDAMLNGRTLDGLVDEVARRKTEPVDWRLQSAQDNGKVSSPGGSLQPELRYDDLERDELVDVLRRNRGNKTSASKELGIARTTLYAKMKKHGLI